MMDIRPMFTRRLSVQGDTAHFFTDSIDVCAVTIMNDALYKDIGLSGNQMRVPWARHLTAGSAARLRGRD